MSLSSSQLSALPTPNGAPYAVEPIDGTGALRITRRFSVPEHLVANGSLAQLVEAYGTADGAYAGTDATKRTPEARRVWADAYLVELRVVPKPAAGAPDGAPEVRVVEKVYEQTPYERDASTNTDAQGAVISTEKTVVCAHGQSLPAAATGYSRVVLGSGKDAGRVIYRVRDVRGQGVLREAYSEDGDGIIVESGSYATMTEPTEPTPGAFDSWTKVPEAGYWRVDYTKPADFQLSPGRVKRNETSRGDGSIVETVSEAGEDPACAPTERAGRTIVLIGRSSYTRAGGLVGRSKTWLVLPEDYDYPDNIRFTMPGLVELVGSDDVTVKVTPPADLLLRGTVYETFGTTADSVAVFNVESPCTYSVHGVLDVEGAKFVLSESRACPGCVGTFAGTGATKWAGVPAAPLAVAGSSTPEARPSGETVAYSRKELYAVGLDDGVKHWHATTGKVTL